MELAKLKNLLGIKDESHDISLIFIMENVQEIILNYCNIDKLPSALINTAYRMAIDLYRKEAIGCEEEPDGSVASIKEGDTQVSFSSDEDYSKTLLKNYNVQLNRYRKLVWR